MVLLSNKNDLNDDVLVKPSTLIDDKTVYSHNEPINDVSKQNVNIQSLKQYPRHLQNSDITQGDIDKIVKMVEDDYWIQRLMN